MTTDRMKKYEIVLGVCGGIAAYKAAMLCSQLTQQGAQVSVVMTEHAKSFVGPLTFSTLSNRPVYDALFDTPAVYHTEHISLAERADIIVVAPATANILGKLAHGICDDPLSTVLAAAESPVLLAPAMNCRMWQHPATQKNIEQLRQWQYHFVGPETGWLACGENAVGRMSEPSAILESIWAILQTAAPKNPR